MSITHKTEDEGGDSNVGQTFLESPAHIDRIGLYAGLLSALEVGLGGLLHAFYIPFTGYILSLNQIFLMSRAIANESHTKAWAFPYYLSMVAALFKSLAPMGKKLTPMLALSMQGLLYSLGVRILNNSIFGRILGAALAALWGFIQPALFYYLVFGQAVFQSWLAVFEKTRQSWNLPEETLIIVLMAIILFKLMLAVGIVLLASYLSPHKFERYLDYFIHWNNQPKSVFYSANRSVKALIWLTFQDLFKPAFLCSLVLTGLFLYFSSSGPQWLIWGIIRPLGAGFLCFFILRVCPMEKWLSYWQGKGVYASLLNATLQQLKRQPNAKKNS